MWYTRTRCDVSGQLVIHHLSSSRCNHLLPARQDPANVNIVNEYNSFNLANVTLPIAPKWKMSETLLDDFPQVQTFLPAYI